MADIRALVFNSGTFRREELNKKSERELWQLWEADDDQAQVQMFYLDEFSCAFNDEEVSDQDWLYFVDLDNIKEQNRESFPITSVSRGDLDAKGFDTSEVDDATMERLASKMADDYCEQLFWSSMEIIAEYMDIPKKVDLPPDFLSDYSEDYRKGIAYVKEQMDEDDKAIIRAECSKAYKMHLVPNGDVVDDSKITDLLEEYGQDNDLPEGWYEEEYDSSEILTML